MKTYTHAEVDFILACLEARCRGRASAHDHVGTYWMKNGKSGGAIECLARAAEDLRVAGLIESQRKILAAENLQENSMPVAVTGGGGGNQ